MENIVLQWFLRCQFDNIYQWCQLHASSETLSSSTIAIEMGKGHCSPGIAQGIVASRYLRIVDSELYVQGNGGRKKGGAGKENGVDTSTGGAGGQNLLKTGGIRSHSNSCTLALTI